MTRPEVEPAPTEPGCTYLITNGISRLPSNSRASMATPVIATFLRSGMKYGTCEIGIPGSAPSVSWPGRREAGRAGELEKVIRGGVEAGAWGLVAGVAGVAAGAPPTGGRGAVDPARLGALPFFRDIGTKFSCSPPPASRQSPERGRRWEAGVVRRRWVGR